MPCHVPATSVSSVRRSPSLSPYPTSIAAKLNLAKPKERAAYDLVRRFSTGRWPRWRPFGMRRKGRTLYIAVEWQRSRAPELYSVVQVSLDKEALRWRYFPTAAAARSVLDRIDERAYRRSRRSVL
jgi:hypothetical protein